MSNVVLEPKMLSGLVAVPPSKSAAHRAVICAALAQGVSVMEPVELSNDIRATIDCVKELGAAVSLIGKRLTIDGKMMFTNTEATLDCGESGSTLRFMIPVVGAGNVKAKFIGHGRLPERPIGIYLECLPKAGVNCVTEGGLPLSINGQLKPGIFEVPGNVSSQFITGLLLALPLLKADSEIVVTSSLESKSYIDMTLSAMYRFGVTAIETENGYKVYGNQSYKPQYLNIEGDWSQAAFFLAAGALGGNISIENLDTASYQGDKAIYQLLRQFGADITINGQVLSCKHNKLNGIEIDAENIPDLVPILAVVAALAEGTTTITGAARLRIKESDRLHAITEGLNKLGADITELPDGLRINGVKSLNGGAVQGYNDHRIVMALSVAATRATEPVIITDAESINKSYPSFFEDYNNLGGNANVINMG